MCSVLCICTQFQSRHCYCPQWVSVGYFHHSKIMRQIFEWNTKEPFALWFSLLLSLSLCVFSSFIPISLWLFSFPRVLLFLSLILAIITFWHTITITASYAESPYVLCTTVSFVQFWDPWIVNFTFILNILLSFCVARISFWLSTELVVSVK